MSPCSPVKSSDFLGALGSVSVVHGDSEWTNVRRSRHSDSSSPLGLLHPPAVNKRVMKEQQEVEGCGVFKVRIEGSTFPLPRKEEMACSTYHPWVVRPVPTDVQIRRGRTPVSYFESQDINFTRWWVNETESVTWEVGVLPKGGST